MDIVLLLAGIALAAVGGEFFVRGSVGLAAWLRIPPGIVGATVAAFATSSPETSVAILASLDGNSELALGDAAGSNLVNLGVVLGLTVVVTPLMVRMNDVRRELPVGIAAIGLMWVFAGDGAFTRIESAAFLSMFSAWMIWVVRDARRERAAVEALQNAPRRRVFIELAAGLLLLVVAGRLVVVAAKGFGDWMGWSEFVVGSLLVAAGTSTPEFVTAMVAARRGHAEVGVGAVLGSNVFNTLFVVGIAGLIHPIAGEVQGLSLAVVLGIVGTLLVVPGRDGRLGRLRGVLLVAVYVAYVAGVLSM